MRLVSRVDSEGQVVVVADQYLQLGQGLVAHVDPPQRLRQRAGRVGDDERVPGVGLGLAWMQVGDAPHGQARKVRHLHTTGTGHRHGQGTDRGGLVDYDQDPAVTGELVEQRAQTPLVVG
jgi:hypothetical protein